MDYVVRFFKFWYKFLIGGDWIGATIVLVGFGATYGIARAGVIAYWMMPLAVFTSLSLYLVRQTAEED